MKHGPSNISSVILALSIFAIGPSSFAQEEQSAAPTPGSFSAAASPPRFQLQAQAGSRVTEVLQIHNMNVNPEQYDIRTGDWLMNENGEVSFMDELVEDSCRPWVKLERRKITVAGNSNRKFRFQISPPEGTTARECRFALYVQGANGGVVTDIAPGLSMPVSGRLAVIIYLSVGDAKPELSVVELTKGDGPQGVLPLLIVSNSGKAHGRLAGLLRARDVDGTSYDVSVSDSPILPGQTRAIPLALSEPGENSIAEPSYPIMLDGSVLWDGGQYKVERVTIQ